MSDPIPSQVSSDSMDENEDFYSSFTPREVNEESAPDGRNLCLTDPERLEKTVLVHNAEKVTPQDPLYVHVLPPTVDLVIGSEILQVIVEAPVNQPLVNSSGGNVEPLRFETAISADPSEIGSEELGATPEDALPAGHPSVRMGKKFKWQCTQPFDDPAKEKKRKAAIKARNDRVKKKQKTAETANEIADLKRKLGLKDEELTRTKKSLADALRENQILKELLQVALDNKLNQASHQN